jgi:alpha-N-arabinofuranosidase
MSESNVAVVKVSAEPMHNGRITNKLYGGFIELLDDLVPGMWAEMLNDRAFEGVGKAVKWCYYTGVPNFCDRDWEENSTWGYDKRNPFIGLRSVKLAADSAKPASLTQSGLALKRGMTYQFSGYFRSDSADLRAKVKLKTLLPNGKWMELASAEIPVNGKDWKKYSSSLRSKGTTDRVVFELEVSGKGNLWVDKLSIMPADNIQGWRKDVVEIIAGQKPGAIRWGGSLIDPGGYKWKAGIGDRDQRVPFSDPYWGRKHPNDVGIDEFLQFCEFVEAEPIVCFSFGDGVQSAKDMIEYCNGSVKTQWGKKRAENGHPEPYNVKCWQLGNELAGEEYSAGCVDFCKMVREVQPDAVIFSSDPTPELFGKVGKYIDVTCPHHYVPDLDKNKASIEHAKSIIKEYGREGETKLGITEWNISAGSWGIQRGKQYTLDSALFAGRYLNLLNDNSDVVEYACRSNMCNSYCCGMIQTNMSDVMGTPSYYTLKLYT